MSLILSRVIRPLFQNNFIDIQNAYNQNYKIPSCVLY